MAKFSLSLEYLKVTEAMAKCNLSLNYTQKIFWLDWTTVAKIKKQVMMSFYFHVKLHGVRIISAEWQRQCGKGQYKQTQYTKKIIIMLGDMTPLS